MPKVLVVDDDIDFRAVLAMLLEDQGFVVTTARDARAALDLLCNETPPSLVILNMEMPVMGGEEFCRRKEKLPHVAAVPVLVISGHPDLGERIRPPRVAEWLRKPPDMAAVLRSVRRLTKFSAHANRKVA